MAMHAKEFRKNKRKIKLIFKKYGYEMRRQFGSATGHVATVFEKNNQSYSIELNNGNTINSSKMRIDIFEFYNHGIGRRQFHNKLLSKMNVSDKNSLKYVIKQEKRFELISLLRFHNETIYKLGVSRNRISAIFRYLILLPLIRAKAVSKSLYVSKY